MEKPRKRRYPWAPVILFAFATVLFALIAAAFFFVDASSDHIPLTIIFASLALIQAALCLYFLFSRE